MLSARRWVVVDRRWDRHRRRAIARASSSAMSPARAMSRHENFARALPVDPMSAQHESQPAAKAGDGSGWVLPSMSNPSCNESSSDESSVDENVIMSHLMVKFVWECHRHQWWVQFATHFLMSWMSVNVIVNVIPWESVMSK